MALNIKNREVEKLAAELARVAHESKTETIRQALLERLARVKARRGRAIGNRSLRDYLERNVWPEVPAHELARVLSHEEEDQILGYGKEGC